MSIDQTHNFLMTDVYNTQRNDSFFKCVLSLFPWFVQIETLESPEIVFHSIFQD